MWKNQDKRVSWTIIAALFFLLICKTWGAEVAPVHNTLDRTAVSKDTMMAIDQNKSQYAIQLQEYADEGRVTPSSSADRQNILPSVTENNGTKKPAYVLTGLFLVIILSFYYLFKRKLNPIMILLNNNAKLGGVSITKRESVSTNFEKEEVNHKLAELLLDKRLAVSRKYENRNVPAELIKLTEMDLSVRKNWRLFDERFDEHYPSFSKDMQDQLPDPSEAEMRLLKLMSLSLTNSELAKTLAVSVEGVKKAKQRLKKKVSG